MALDIEVANEISRQISEQSNKNRKPSSNIKSVIARRKQARAAASSNKVSEDELVNMLSGLGKQ